MGLPSSFFAKPHLDDAELALAHDFGFALHDAHQQAAARGAERAELGFQVAMPGTRVSSGTKRMSW